MANVLLIAFLGLLACIQLQTCTGSKDIKKDVKVIRKSRGWQKDTVPFVRNNQVEANGNLVGSSHNTVISSTIEDSLAEQDKPSKPYEIVASEEAPPSYVKCAFKPPTTIKLESNDIDVIRDNGEGAQETLTTGSIIQENNQGNFPKSPKNNEREIEGDLRFGDIVTRRRLQRLPSILRELGTNEFEMSDLTIRRALRRLNNMKKLEMLKKIRAMEALKQLGIGSLDDLYGLYQYMPRDAPFRIKDSSKIGIVGGSNGVANIRQTVGLSGLDDDIGYNGDGGGWSINFEGKGRRKSFSKDITDRLPWDFGEGDLGMQISGVRLASSGSSGIRRRGRLGLLKESDATEKAMGDSKVIKTTVNRRADSPSLEVKN